MKAWQKVWREGILPQLSIKAKEALRKALEEDDPRLTQGSTTTPPPLLSVRDWPCEGACALGFCGWQGEELETVGQVEEYFAKTCYAANDAIGDLRAIGYFLNWFDDTPRKQMRRELLEELAC